MARTEGERTPGSKLLLAILIGAALAIPLFSVWLLVYDRQTQSEQATRVDHRRLGRSADDLRTDARHPLSRDRERDRGRERAKRDPQPRHHARADAGARDCRRCDDGRAGAAQALDLRSGRLRREAHRLGALRLPAGPRASRRQGRGHGPVAGRTALRRQRSARARRQSRSRRRTAAVCGSSRAAEAAAGAGSSPGSMPASLASQPIAVRYAFEMRGNSALTFVPQGGDTIGRSARPGRTRRSAATSCRSNGASMRKGSRRSTGSAIWRWANRWSRPATWSEQSTDPSRQCRRYVAAASRSHRSA